MIDFPLSEQVLIF